MEIFPYMNVMELLNICWLAGTCDSVGVRVSMVFAPLLSLHLNLSALDNRFVVLIPVFWYRLTDCPASTRANVPAIPTTTLPTCLSACLPACLHTA